MKIEVTFDDGTVCAVEGVQAKYGAWSAALTPLRIEASKRGYTSRIEQLLVEEQLVEYAKGTLGMVNE